MRVLTRVFARIVTTIYVTPADGLAQGCVGVPTSAYNCLTGGGNGGGGSNFCGSNSGTGGSACGTAQCCAQAI